MDDDRTVKIPAGNMDRLTHEIEKLNKRARTIGVPELSLIVHSTELIRDASQMANLKQWYRDRPIPQEKLDKVPLIEWHTVEITGEGPVVKDYKFIGRLDHETIHGSVIVRGVPGETVPAQFFEANPICDHCNTQRYRKDTFLFEHTKTGLYKQVGRSCLVDFFGHDPMKIARWLQNVWALCDSIEGDEWGEPMGSGSFPTLYRADALLEATVAMIRTYGWVSSARAQQSESMRATSWEVATLFDPPKQFAKERRAWEEWRDTIQFDEEVDKATAVAAREWLSEKTDADNAYFHNLAVLHQADAIPQSQLGIWCSLIATYQRSQDELEEAAKRLNINEHWGEIKVRAELEFECVKAIPLEPNDYGERMLYKLLTKEGHSLTWFSTPGKLEQGHLYKGKATPQKHDEYKDWKQTIVSRVTAEQIERWTEAPHGDLLEVK